MQSVLMRKNGRNHSIVQVSFGTSTVMATFQTGVLNNVMKSENLDYVST